MGNVSETADHCYDGIVNGRCCKIREQNEPKRLDNIFARDVIIGLSDGLTVPFALTAGLSSLGSSHLVVIGGLAELFSGAISMGIGGFLSTKAERDNYRYLLRKTQQLVESSCARALEQEIFKILSPYGLSTADSKRIVQSLNASDRTALDTVNGNEGIIKFLLKFGEGVESISTVRLYASALTIGFSYFIGGLIPMVPYFCIYSATSALFISIGVTAIILIIFGALKGYLTGSHRGWVSITASAAQTLAVGALAAGSSYGIVRALAKDNSQY